MSSKHPAKNPVISLRKPLFWVVEKPAGLPTHPLTQGGQANLVDWLKKEHPALSKIGGEKECGLPYRLDNNTSGICVVAQKEAFYEELRDAWNTPAVSKTYLALVVGILPHNGEITHPIGHHPSNSKKMQVATTSILAEDLKARPASTSWKTIKRWEGKSGTYSLAEVSITTGVRHQIRAHLSWLGHPLVGDVLYQNPTKRKLDRLNLDRHFLHLHRVEWNLEKSKEKIESPLPQDLLDCLTQL